MQMIHHGCLQQPPVIVLHHGLHTCAHTHTQYCVCVSTVSQSHGLSNAEAEPVVEAQQ